MDFGCKGDGAADDWGCLQAGIDAAIRQGRRFRVPAGQYLVSQPLRIAGANATNATTGATEALTSLAMEGDGLAQTKIVASTKMFAVIMYPTCCGDLAPTTTHQYIGKMVIDSNGTADYGIQGSAITGSLFEELYVVNSQVAGISLGFGYNNRIVNSELESNYMGVVVMNADNNVQVERCVIVDCIVGIYIGGGLGVKVTGCDIEGNGGPAIIAFGTRALTIDSNYFEANNKVASWAATGPPGWVGKPFTMVPEGPLSGDPTGELTGDLTVQSDVVLNGGPSWNEGNTWLGQPGNGSIYNVSRFPRWTYGIAYPVTAAQLINNFHNEPVGAAYLIIACAHCRFDGNAIGAHYGSHEQDKDPITRECGHDPRALIAVSTDRRISLARHISARNNDGFCWRTTDKSGSKGIGLALSNAGLLEVLPPLLPAANMSIAVPTSRPTVSPDGTPSTFRAVRACGASMRSLRHHHCFASMPSVIPQARSPVGCGPMRQPAHHGCGSLIGSSGGMVCRPGRSRVQSSASYLSVGHSCPSRRLSQGRLSTLQSSCASSQQTLTRITAWQCHSCSKFSMAMTGTRLPTIRTRQPPGVLKLCVTATGECTCSWQLSVGMPRMTRRCSSCEWAAVSG